MDSLYSGMSVGFGFLIFFAILSFVLILFKNFKKRMIPQNRSTDLIDLINFQVEEKRNEKRADIVWPVSVETGNDIIKTETKDLTRSGAFIKCSKPLKPGEQFVLAIETPAKGTISLNAEVVWSNANIPEDKVVTRGMGIRFIKNTDNDLKYLKSSLEEYLESISSASL